MHYFCTLLVLGACGDDAMDNDAGAPRDAARTDAGSTRDSGSFDADGLVPLGVLRTSYVDADSYDDGFAQTSSFGAGFYDQEVSPLPFSYETIGPCIVRSTMFLDVTFLRNADAGTIRMTGGAEEVTLAFGAGGYAIEVVDGALWTGGETLRFSSTGADVAAFDVEVTAPRHVTMTAPALPLGADFVLDRGRDLPVMWTGGAEGELEVQIDGPQELPMPQVDLRCRFPASAGAGTIPTAALQRIVPVGRGIIGANVVSRGTAIVPDWGTVEVTARSAALGRGRWLHPVELR
jgi:hypothetical protein